MEVDPGAKYGEATAADFDGVVAELIAQLSQPGKLELLPLLPLLPLLARNACTLISNLRRVLKHNLDEVGPAKLAQLAAHPLVRPLIPRDAPLVGRVLLLPDNPVDERLALSRHRHAQLELVEPKVLEREVVHLVAAGCLAEQMQVGASLFLLGDGAQIDVTSAQRFEGVPNGPRQRPDGRLGERISLGRLGRLDRLGRTLHRLGLCTLLRHLLLLASLYFCRLLGRELCASLCLPVLGDQ